MKLVVLRGSKFWLTQKTACHVDKLVRLDIAYSASFSSEADILTTYVASRKYASTTPSYVQRN